mgnify:CR=1 FL=1
MYLDVFAQCLSIKSHKHNRDPDLTQPHSFLENNSLTAPDQCIAIVVSTSMKEATSDIHNDVFCSWVAQQKPSLSNMCVTSARNETSKSPTCLIESVFLSHGTQLANRTYNDLPKCSGQPHTSTSNAHNYQQWNVVSPSKRDTKRNHNGSDVIEHRPPSPTSSSHDCALHRFLQPDARNEAHPLWCTG